jgi:replication factor C small subunit
MTKQGVYGLDLIKSFQKEIAAIDMPIEKKVKIMEKVAEIEFRIAEGGDELIQLESLLAFISYVGK